MSLERLDKVISSVFALTRSEARTAVRRGRVAVEGKTVRSGDYKIDPETTAIFLDGKTAQYKKNVYFIMNKPKGTLSASNDKNAKTVIDLLPPEIVSRGVFPVGRLDKDTTGFLLITDDGDFCHRLMAPNKNVFKTYEVLLDGEIPDNAPELFSRGVTLADGTECRPAKLEIIDKNRALVSISEGKFHQVKRMFGVLGLGVNELKRISVAGMKLPEELLEGEARELTEEELKFLNSLK